MTDSAKGASELFPIQDGPSIPWSVILPHEQQAIKNHGQTLRELAGRGGLGAGEAWFIVNDQKYQSFDVKVWDAAKQSWREYAEKANWTAAIIAARNEGFAQGAEQRTEQIVKLLDGPSFWLRRIDVSEVKKVIIELPLPRPRACTRKP